MTKLSRGTAMSESTQQPAAPEYQLAFERYFAALKRSYPFGPATAVAREVYELMTRWLSAPAPVPWVEVSEKLPDTMTQFYLVLMSADVEDYRVALYYKGEWWSGGKQLHPVYYMPLPAPPVERA